MCLLSRMLCSTQLIARTRSSRCIRYTVSGSNGVLRWWVNGRLVDELTRPLIVPPTMRFEKTYVGRSNWKGDDFLNGNVYYLSALNTALSPQQAIDKSNELLKTLGVSSV